MRKPTLHYFALLKGENQKPQIVTPYKHEGFYWTEGMSLHPEVDFEWIDETSVEDLREAYEKGKRRYEYWKRKFQISEGLVTTILKNLSSPPESNESNK